MISLPIYDQSTVNARPENSSRWPARNGELTSNGGLLGTRFDEMSANTVEYWRLPESTVTTREVVAAFERSEYSQDSNLQLYLHVPFCPQTCRFCAFSAANSISFRQGARYADALAAHLKNVTRRSQAHGHDIKSIFIGGGTPDVLGTHINALLSSATSLPGVSAHTEVGCECALLTVTEDFIRVLVDNGATRLSFGIQSFDPAIREQMRLRGLIKLNDVLRWAHRRIPVINADLMTGLPGQTLQTVLTDLELLMAETRINAITTYDFSPANAPSVVAGLRDATLPSRAAWQEQAMMRLHSYTTLLQNGWVRRGTNTYVHPDRMSPEDFERISGNESIATDRYESFLIAVGPSAKSHVPGLRLEECNDLNAWFANVERGELPVHLPSCAHVHQRDLALWLFPLRHEGLPFEAYDKMVATDAISDEQKKTFAAYINDGLIIPGRDTYHLSILGEVFMGHLVRDLKGHAGQIGFDRVDEDAQRIADSIARGELADRNAANDRQEPGGGWLVPE